MRTYWIRIFLLSVAVISFAAACSPAAKPTVVIESPPNGAQVNKDDDVPIRFSATDSNGIARIEVTVDGTSIKTDAVQPVGTYAGVEKWKAAIGTHTISIRAFNSAGATSDPVSVSLNVVQNTPTPSASATATTPPTAAPSATATRLVSPTPGAKENLISALTAALSKIKAYRVKVIQDIAHQDAPERIIEVMPNRFRQIQPNDVRQIGNRVYVPDPGITYTLGGLWYAFERVYLPWLSYQIQQAKQVTLLGRSVVDGQQLVGYQTTIQVQNTNLSTPGAQLDYTDQPAKIWFSPQSGFPVRLDVGQPLQFINIYYDFNANIDEIGPP